LWDLAGHFIGVTMLKSAIAVQEISSGMPRLQR